MCGIVGVINYGRVYNTKVKDLIQQMLLVDVLRGYDATGVFKAKGKNVDWRKAAVPSWEFRDLKGVPEFFNGLGDMPFIVGHNRWATRGEKTNKNAHPFEEGKVTLVHNGTLNSVWQLPDHAKFDVDSNLIAHAINKIGVDETYKKAGGAMALVWYNTKEQQLYMIRNTERPLWLMNLPKEQITLFGSEIGLLRWIAMRNGMECGESRLLPEHVLHTFVPGEEKPRVRTLEPYRIAGGTGSDWGFVRRHGYGGTGSQHFHPVSSPNRPSYTSPIYTPPSPGGQSNAQVNAVTKYKVRDVILFSVNDFADKVQGGFVPVVGDIPGPDGKPMLEFIVKGNFSGDETDLVTSKNLFMGTISSIHGIKGNRAIINVSSMKQSEVKDPFFMSEAEKKEWFKPRQQKKTPVKDALDLAIDELEQKIAEKKDPLARLEQIRAEQGEKGEAQCAVCNAWFLKEKLFTIIKGSGTTRKCITCLHKTDPTNAAMAMAREENFGKAN